MVAQELVIAVIYTNNLLERARDFEPVEALYLSLIHALQIGQK